LSALLCNIFYGRIENELFQDPTVADAATGASATAAASAATSSWSSSSSSSSAAAAAAASAAGGVGAKALGFPLSVARACVVRLVDDFLLVSPDAGQAAGFLAAMGRAHAAGLLALNHAKTRTNLPEAACAAALVGTFGALAAGSLARSALLYF
jgi:hypothetical protein